MKSSRVWRQPRHLLVYGIHQQLYLEMVLSLVVKTGATPSQQLVTSLMSFAVDAGVGFDQALSVFALAVMFPMNIRYRHV